MDLTQFWSLNEKIEIHITNVDDKSNDQDDWEIIDHENFLSSENHKVNVEIPSSQINIKETMLQLDDMSILSNQEASIAYDDLLKEKFTDFELEQVLNNAKNETKMELLREQKMQEYEFEDQKKKLENFYESKIMESETTIADLNSELEKVKSSLVNTRSDLHDQTQLYKILQSEITKLESIETKSEAIEAELSKLKEDRQNIVQERSQLKKDIISLNDKKESMQKEISELANQLKESEAIQVTLKKDVACLKISCSDKENVISEYENTIKKCKKNLEAHKDAYDKKTSELSNEINIWKSSYEKQKCDYSLKQEQLIQATADLDDMKNATDQAKIEMEEILTK